jgi:hypothetical protein
LNCDDLPLDGSRFIEGPKLKGGSEGDNLVFSHSSNPDDDKTPNVVPLITKVSVTSVSVTYKGSKYRAVHLGRETWTSCMNTFLVSKQRGLQAL